ncbi:peptidase inhibitor family I36 protein [Myceligenerans crystallogenes]|uniref:Peptidase inhibitor family I36 n=1 Tax=Myceligenerans crystallogenes TaxID=316335 RepID=A0ABN2NJK6_9MICO
MRKNTLVRRIAATAAAVTMLGAAMVAVPTSAQAAVTCSYGNVCFYYYKNLAGAARSYSASDKSMYDERFNRGGTSAAGYGVRVENHSSSVYNRTGQRVLMFKNRGCYENNEYALAIPHGAAGNFADTDYPGYDNNIASVKIGSGRCINR